MRLPTSTPSANAIAGAASHFVPVLAFQQARVRVGIQYKYPPAANNDCSYPFVSLASEHHLNECPKPEFRKRKTTAGKGQSIFPRHRTASGQAVPTTTILVSLAGCKRLLYWSH